MLSVFGLKSPDTLSNAERRTWMGSDMGEAGRNICMDSDMGEAAFSCLDRERAGLLRVWGCWARPGECYLFASSILQKLLTYTPPGHSM